jgi:platelet-activating factor acetylhydrolase IB subunit alpha
MRWAPNVVKDVPVNGDAPNGASNGLSKKKEEEAAKAGIRCVIATGCVDLNVRIFAS